SEPSTLSLPDALPIFAEVDLENQGGGIFPGSYVTVKLAARARGYPELPAGALIVRGDTTLVAVVDSADHERGVTAHDQRTRRQRSEEHTSELQSRGQL